MRSENLGELVSSAAAFEDAWEPDEDDSLGLAEAFLSSTALEAGERGEGASGDAVQLMTLHMAKGLEFPLVFIVGLEDGILPMTREGSSLEEERRLCYVGMTRAQQQLVLTHAYERLIFERWTVNQAFQRGSGFVPAGVVVVFRRTVQAERQIVPRAHPFGCIDCSSLQRHQ